MSSLSALLILTLIGVEICGKELFCARDRKPLLGGVFNYDKVLFAYSWKEVKGVQMWFVWRFEIKSNRLVAIGKDTSVDQIFPGIPVFRGGFGLTIKCGKNDGKCRSYRQLVFVFFLNSYKVYRFANDTISAETDPKAIPWGLSPTGEVTDWFFDSTTTSTTTTMTTTSINIDSIMLAKKDLFVVSKETLYVSAVDINASRLKWKEVSKSKDLAQTMGGFVIGSQLLINTNEAPNSVLMRYDLKGTQLDKALN